MIDGATAPPAVIQFQVIAMFMIGCMLYLAIIPLIFYRLTFVPLSREDFSPPYWINMGAVAIKALAGSILILRGGIWTMVTPLLPFPQGLHFLVLGGGELVDTVPLRIDDLAVHLDEGPVHL